jgi:hypothetical protein
MIGSLAGWADTFTIIGATVGSVAFLLSLIIAGYKAWSKLKAVENQVTPNGGTTDTVGDRMVQVQEHLRIHIEADAMVQDAIMQKLSMATDRMTRMEQRLIEELRK